ncbi:MAG: putative cysteine protease (Transglutaminase-like) [Pseudobdellovibrio sp.]|nr:putative cysteine protease (Transglutaminase-like) [Pseudobdellovibrio sp.]
MSRGISFFANTPLAVSLLTTLAIAATEVPLWASLFSFLFVGWRFLFEKYGMYKLSPKITPIFGLMFFLIVYVQHRTIFGQEESITILIGLTSITILNYAVERDLLFMVLLGFLMLVLKSVFSLDFVWVVPALVSYFGLWMTLLSNTRVKRSRYVMKAMLKSVPALIILFVAFPRFVLFQVNRTVKQAPLSGFNEELSPGRFSEIANSDEMVFRAQFANTEHIDGEQLYWRGSVLVNSNGLIWTKGITQRKVISYVQPANKAKVMYEVILEPNKTVRNIFALDAPVKVRSAEAFSEWSHSVFMFANTSDQRIQYEGEASFGQERVLLEDPVSDIKYLKTTELPPKSREWVQNIKNKYSSIDERLKALTSFFERPGFIYTLKPGTYGNDLDEFLFVRKKGYCEHYAAAFATLARALEIPSRVVIGYQGGYYNALSDFWKISQRDAHAWVEVGVSGAWRRVDPTALVSPLRITLGSTEYFSMNEVDQMLFSKDKRFNSVTAFQKFYRGAMAVVDSLNYSWTIFLLNYDMQAQIEILKDLRFNWVFLFISVVIILGIIFFITRKKAANRNSRHELYRLYMDIESWGQKNQVAFDINATPKEVLSGLAAKFPEYKEFLVNFEKQYEQLVYQERSQNLNVAGLIKEWDALTKRRKHA